MERFTQKYIIVQLLEPMAEGAEYASADWPLHVTLAGIFSVDLTGERVIEQLRDMLVTQKPFTVIAGQDAYFGVKKQTRVTVLEISDELRTLHYKVVALLRWVGAEFNTPEFIEAGFRAHATVRPHARLRRGDTVTFHALTVIDMYPNGNPYRRKVLRTLPFHEQ